MIRKIISALYLFLLVSILANCQNNFSPELDFGVRGGISHSHVYFNPLITSDFINEPSGGFFIRYISEPRLGIQLEVNNVVHGWKNESDSTGNYYRSMRYLEIPLLTHYEIGKGLVKVTLDIGPGISLLRKISEKYNTAVNPHKNFYNSYDENFHPMLYKGGSKDSVIYGEANFAGLFPQKNFDYGFLAGLGLGIDTKGGKIMLEVRYSNGLYNLFPKYPKGNFRNTYSQSYFVGISYCYPIKFKPKASKQIEFDESHNNIGSE